MDTDIPHLRQQAARCRRLAAGIPDDQARDRLLQLAQEYEARARALETLRARKQ